MTTELPLLSLLIWLPVIGGAWVLFAGSRAPAGAVRADALLISLATLALSLPLWAGYQPEGAGMQFVEKAVWIGAFDIHYHLGVDGIAVPLILLTTLTTVLVVLAGWESIRERVREDICHKIDGFLISSCRIKKQELLTFFDATRILAIDNRRKTQDMLVCIHKHRIALRTLQYMRELLSLRMMLQNLGNRHVLLRVKRTERR